MEKKNAQGFTLIELMIVITIVAILAAISFPQYMIFQMKAKRSEAYALLHSGELVENVYFLDNDTYTKDLSNFLNLGWIESLETVPKYYSPLFFKIHSDQITMGYVMELKGNIDKDALQDDIILVAGSPGPVAAGYAQGIHILIDDITM